MFRDNAGRKQPAQEGGEQEQVSGAVFHGERRYYEWEGHPAYRDDCHDSPTVLQNGQWRVLAKLGIDFAREADVIEEAEFLALVKEQGGTPPPAPGKVA